MTSKERAARDAAIQGAMANLVTNPNFGEFINVVREQREVAIEDLCSERVMANERLVMAAVGELRAYKSIIAAYDEFLDRREMDAEQE